MASPKIACSQIVLIFLPAASTYWMSPGRGEGEVKLIKAALLDSQAEQDEYVGSLEYDIKCLGQEDP